MLLSRIRLGYSHSQMQHQTSQECPFLQALWATHGWMSIWACQVSPFQNTCSCASSYQDDQDLHLLCMAWFKYFPYSVCWNRLSRADHYFLILNWSSNDLLVCRWPFSISSLRDGILHCQSATWKHRWISLANIQTISVCWALSVVGTCRGIG